MNLNPQLLLLNLQCTVDKIKKMDGYDGSFEGPVMSNLAISKKYRRKGLAEDLVKATENIARKEWGYDTCYLYVEKRNTPAIKLYKKLGYSTVWEDENATTLLPTEDGRVGNGKTTIVCMKKKVNSGLLGNLFGQ
jgi:N-acetylglutamate synthase-like GNAT family acetyltransferase